MPTLNQAKAYLRIDGSADDALLTDLLAAADAAWRSYTGVAAGALPDMDAQTGMMVYVQARYEGTPEQQAIFETACHLRWQPGRIDMGV